MESILIPAISQRILRIRRKTPDGVRNLRTRPCGVASHREPIGKLLQSYLDFSVHYSPPVSVAPASVPTSHSHSYMDLETLHSTSAVAPEK